MFFLKKNLLKSLSGFFVILAMLFVFFSQTQVTINAATYKGLIVIDPGHGWTDIGATYGGVEERMINAQLSYKVAKKLQSAGYEVFFTHDISYATDVPQDIPTLLGKINGKYNIDTQLVPAINAKNPDIMISIHHNAASSTTASGFEAYYRTSGTPANTHARSQFLGTSVTNAMKSLTYIPPRNTPVKDDIYKINKANVPSILLEAGFMSNPSELANLTNSTRQNEMATTIVSGINTYFSKYATNVQVPTAESVQLSNLNTNAGTFRVTANGVSASNGIKDVKIAVWSKSNQSDIVWYTATASGNNYYVDVDIKNHNYNRGTYYAHAYATDNAGIMQFVGDVSTSMPTPTTTISASVNTAQSQATVTVGNVSTYGALSVAVWSTENGQDDLKWYNLASGATRTLNVNISDHKNSMGQYNVHVYSGSTLLKSTSFTVTPPSASSITITHLDTTAGTFRVVLGGATSPAGVKSVLIPVWTKADQSDIHWYTALQSGSSYYVDVDIKNHNYNSGTYKVHAYVLDNRNVQTVVKSTTVSMPTPTTSINTSVNAAHSQATVTVGNVNRYGNLSVAVWSTENGQDDLKWYNLASGATRTLNVNISDHKNSTGKYTVHVYSGSTLLTSTSFTITPPSASSITITRLDTTAGTFRVVLGGATSPAGVKSVLIPVWTKADQSDIHWYTALQSDTRYYVDVDIKNHNYNSGTYKVHAYVLDNRNVQTVVKSTTVSMPAQTISINTSVNTAHSQATVTVGNANRYGNLSVAVWSTENGQDDLKWYNLASGATRTLNVNISDHKNSTGKYTVHVYSGSTLLTSTSFTITPPSASSMTATNVDTTAGTFRIVLSGVTSPAGIKSVRIPVWSKADQSNIVWYTATQSGNSYYVDVNISNHAYHNEVYIAHAYVMDNRNVEVFAKSTTVDMSAAGYRIMGTSNVTVSQMVSYFNSYKKTYPSAVLATGGAATIQEFAQIVYDVAISEGVKPEIVFTQAMKETGFLQFGGDVKIEQFNFCGLGATGGGVAGNSFADVRTGILAQVQHLVAYADPNATEATLKNACVDPRFKYVKKGVAPYVEWLGIPNNPTGAGWAAANNYGYDIVNMISNVKKY